MKKTGSLHTVILDIGDDIETFEQPFKDAECGLRAATFKLRGECWY